MDGLIQGTLEGESMFIGGDLHNHARKDNGG